VEGSFIFSIENLIDLMKGMDHVLKMNKESGIIVVFCLLIFRRIQ